MGNKLTELVACNYQIEGVSFSSGWLQKKLIKE